MSNNTLKYVIIAGLVLFPVLYLVFQSSNSDNKKTVTNIQSGSGISSIDEMEALVKTDPSAKNLIDLSVLYINNKMPEKSLGYLYKVIEMNPENPVAYNNLCVAYTMLKQYDKGIEAGTKALSIRPDFQLAKNNLKWATNEKAKLEAAENSQ
jgi:protein O-mannosyl-transferase